MWQKNADQTGGIQFLPPPQSIKDADATRMQLLELNQDLISSIEYYAKAVQDLRSWKEYIATQSFGNPERPGYQAAIKTAEAALPDKCCYVQRQYDRWCPDMCR